MSRSPSEVALKIISARPAGCSPRASLARGLIEERRSQARRSDRGPVITMRFARSPGSSAMRSSGAGTRLVLALLVTRACPTTCDGVGLKRKSPGLRGSPASSWNQSCRPDGQQRRTVDRLLHAATRTARFRRVRSVPELPRDRRGRLLPLRPAIPRAASSGRGRAPLLQRRNRAHRVLRRHAGGGRGCLRAVRRDGRDRPLPARARPRHRGLLRAVRVRPRRHPSRGRMCARRLVNGHDDVIPPPKAREARSVALIERQQSRPHRWI